MSRILLFFVLLLSLGLWGAGNGKTRIELIDDRENSTAELRRHIRALQENVIEMRSRIDQLEAKLGAAATAPGNIALSPNGSAQVTCFLETPFDGIYDSTQSTETKARLEAVKACMTKVKSRIHCSTEKVKCGQ